MSPDLSLTLALTGLLESGTPLTPDLLAAAHRASLPGAANSVDRTRLRRLLAAHPGTTPAACAELATDASPLVRAAVVTNPAAGAPARLVAVQAETDGATLTRHADTLTDPDLLTALAARAGAAPRPRGQTWIRLGDALVPAPERLWEDVAARLLANPALPVPAGLDLLAALEVNLRVDARGAAGSDDPYSGANSVLWPGVAAFAAAHPQAVRPLVLADDAHPWLLAHAAAHPQAEQAVIARALTALVHPVLARPRREGVPGTIARLVLTLVPRLDAGAVEALRTALAGWDLTRRPDLAQLVTPPPPPLEDDAAARYATGDPEELIADAASRPHEIRAGRIPIAAALAFVARADVSTDQAWRMLRAGGHNSPESYLAARAHDRAFGARLLAGTPGLLRQHTDPELALATIALMLTPGFWTRGDDPVRCLNQEVLDRLGPRLLELPWPALARLVGTHPQVAAAVAAELAVLVDPGAARLFAAASAGHTGTLAELTAAVRAASAPTG